MLPNRGKNYGSHPGSPRGGYRHGSEDDGPVEQGFGLAQRDYLPPSVGGTRMTLLYSSPVLTSPSTSPFRAVPNPTFGGHVEDVFYSPLEVDRNINKSAYEPVAGPDTNSGYAPGTPASHCVECGNQHHPQCRLAQGLSGSFLEESQLPSQAVTVEDLLREHDQSLPLFADLAQIPSRSISTRPTVIYDRPPYPHHLIRSQSMPLSETGQICLPRTQPSMRQMSHADLSSALNTEQFQLPLMTTSPEESPTVVVATLKPEVKPYTRQFTLSHNRALDSTPP
ncbi:hypothetical protein B0O99DRAFT_210280 [Bisporella sp. PMI_857]|nr:hypothetical protein B0O99DRAFT_210280 [Bisporella sp. PMI_857]